LISANGADRGLLGVPFVLSAARRDHIQDCLKLHDRDVIDAADPISRIKHKYSTY